MGQKLNVTIGVAVMFSGFSILSESNGAKTQHHYLQEFTPMSFSILSESNRAKIDKWVDAGKNIMEFQYSQ